MLLAPCPTLGQRTFFDSEQPLPGDPKLFLQLNSRYPITEVVSERGLALVWG